MDEPVERLLAAARRAGNEDQMCVLKEGKTEFFSPDEEEGRTPYAAGAVCA
jgi:hypothetical protein